MLPALLALAQSFSADVPGAPTVNGPVAERAILRSIDIAPGSGDAAQPGQEYTVHYTGYLRDGKKFDSSLGRDPFVFVQGRRQVIAGFDNAYEGMRVGGKRRVFIPYQLAYGEKGRGAIPPKAELIFDVELLGVKDVPEEKASLGVLAPLHDYEKKLMALARAIPEDKYGFAPAAGVRPVREVLAHVAYGNRLMLDLSNKMPPAAELKARVEQQWKNERVIRGKDELLKMLEESFAAIHKQAEPLRAAQLAGDRQFFRDRTTLHGVYTFLISHIAEHTGQLIAYARTMGIAPPWSAQ